MNKFITACEYIYIITFTALLGYCIIDATYSIGYYLFDDKWYYIIVIPWSALSIIGLFSIVRTGYKKSREK